jgi:hypothetical protein
VTAGDDFGGERTTGDDFGGERTTDRLAGRRRRE